MRYSDVVPALTSDTADLADLAPAGATDLAVDVHRAHRHDEDPDGHLHALTRAGQEADTPASRWAAVVASWLLGKRSMHTRDAYGRDAKAWTDWLAERGRTPWEADRDDATAWVAHLRRTSAPRSAARRTAAAASLHHHACLQDPALVAECDPFIAVERPRPDEADDDPGRVVTRALHELHPDASAADPDQVAIGRDVEALRRIQDAAWAMGEDHGLTVALLIRGARAGEVGGIVATDVEQAGRDVRVVVTRKGGRRERVEVTGRAAGLLVQRAADRPDGTLLSTPTGAPFTRHTVTRTVARAARAAGIDGKVTPHTLRATTATLLIMDGTANLAHVQAMLGHSQPSTTLMYGRRRTAREAVSALDRLIGTD